MLEIVKYESHNVEGCKKWASRSRQLWKNKSGDKNSTRPLILTSENFIRTSEFP